MAPVDDGYEDLFHMSKVKGKRARPKQRIKRTLSDRGSVVHRHYDQKHMPVLERDPIDPPPVPSSDAPAKQRTMKGYVGALLEWMISPAQVTD